MDCLDTEGVHYHLSFPLEMPKGTLTSVLQGSEK